MSEQTPTFLRRRQSAPAPRPEPASDVDVHPEVKAFLSRMRSDADAVHQTRMQLEEARLLIDKMEGRLTWATDRLTSTTRQRDVSQKGYAEQQIHFAVALTSALAAKDHALAAVDAAYRGARATNDAAYEQAKAANDGAYAQAMGAVKAAYEPFVEAAHAAMRSIQQEMREAGVDPMEGERATSNPGAEIDIVKIGERFGANARAEEDPA